MQSIRADVGQVWRSMFSRTRQIVAQCSRSLISGACRSSCCASCCRMPVTAECARSLQRVDITGWCVSRVLTWSVCVRRDSAGVYPLLQRARFAVQCDSATFDVFERMDMRSLAWISWTIDLVMDARADCVGLARAFLSSTCYRENVRDVTFEDEWARTVYDNLPLNSPMRPGPLDPFSRVLSDFVRSTRLTHIRLVSIQLDPELVTCLANASTLSQVTADRCLPCSFIGRPRVEEYLRLQHIAYLALGFGSDMRLHHATWALMNACPFLRHLVIFRSSGRPIACPAFVSVRDFSLAHTLETLHVEGSSGNLSGLFHLLRPADGASPSSSMLSCLKVSICGSVSASIVYALLQLLAMHHPRLRILVFEGVLIVRPLFVMDVCAHLPGLQGLSLFQRRGVSPPCDGHTLSVWDAPLYEYANALAGSALRHFQANFHCDTSAYGPRVLDRLVGLRALDSRAAPNACGGSSVFPHSCRSCCRSADDDDDDGDRAEDVLSIVSPFAAACTTLESFVVRAGRVTRFSCSVRRASGGTPEVHRVLLGEYDDAMHKWNPPLSRSWGRM